MLCQSNWILTTFWTYLESGEFAVISASRAKVAEEIQHPNAYDHWMYARDREEKANVKSKINPQWAVKDFMNKRRLLQRFHTEPIVIVLNAQDGGLRSEFQLHL
jgi:hypothetical protein